MSSVSAPVLSVKERVLDLAESNFGKTPRRAYANIDDDGDGDEQNCVL